MVEKNSMLELSVQMDAFYPLKRPILIFFFEDISNYFFDYLQWWKAWASVSLFYIKQSCCLWFKWFMVFSWKIIVWLCMNFLWIIRTISYEDRVCVMSFLHSRDLYFFINIVYYVHRCNTFVNICSYNRRLTGAPFFPLSSLKLVSV